MNSENTSLMGNTDTVQCDMCEKYFTNYNGGTPERGLDISFIGGYGLFHDDNANFEKVVLCHDCSVVLIRMFPKFKDKRGFHSVSINANDYPLCCEYSWTFDTINGEVVPVCGEKKHFDERQK